ncbi:MAG: viperin family antiviral radical SAM protein [Candidatus Thermoplasmatota archaeon]|nr:viperin family antiviral radical SAM protein [Candidatus Thermoplasmatota archaeon]
MSNSINKEIDIPKAVNWHCEAYCNYGCKFCYASFEIQRTLPRLSEEEGFSLIKQLVDAGVEKINFVGGEPMLHRHISSWIVEAKRLGLTTSIVSNGTNMSRDWLEKMRPHLDWLGLSIDASSDQLHVAIGRGQKRDLKKDQSNHLSESLEIIENAKELGYGIKLNTVVTRENLNDDMIDIVLKIRPTRWKIFQVLKIEGENDGRVEPLLISEKEFEEYVNRHREGLAHVSKIQIVSEDNETMLGTYAMIDAQGRFYTNAEGRYLYSEAGIHEIGFSKAWSQISSGFCEERFTQRDGYWEWKTPSSNTSSIKLPFTYEEVY